MTGKRQQLASELQAHFHEQWRFLRSSCDAFDAGDSSEAKRISTSLRTLVHDTHRSQSLLGQLGLHDFLFFDTGEDVNPDNLMATIGLLFIQVSGLQAQYVIPPADIPLPRPVWLVPFDAWWKKTVVAVPSEKIALSRRDLVLTMADQDGGAHVDPAVEEPYYRVSREHAGSWSVMTPAGLQPLPDIERASVRQIAQEVLVTLTARLREIPRDLPGLAAQPRVSFVLDALTGETKRIEHTPREVCPCKSGRPYRDCHGSKHYP